MLGHRPDRLQRQPGFDEGELLGPFLEGLSYDRAGGAGTDPAEPRDVWAGQDFSMEASLRSDVYFLRGVDEALPDSGGVFSVLLERLRGMDQLDPRSSTNQGPPEETVPVQE